MKSCTGLMTLFVCATFPIICSAQTESFDLDEYQQYLEQNRDMSTSELLQMYPSGGFLDEVDIPWETAQYSDAIDSVYQMTDDEKRLLRRHGFVVTERLKKDSFVDHLRELWVNDLPLFISSDAILHAFHYHYDELLINIELGILVDHLTTLLAEMHNGLPDLAAKYASISEMQQMLQDVDVYLTVPRRLLGETVSPVYAENTAEIEHILALIDTQTLATHALFSENCREIDFSQFKPRGHYTQRRTLRRYFQAMMWLGRTELYLLAPQASYEITGCAPQTPIDIQRQTIDAALLLELMDRAGVNSIHEDIERILSLSAGRPDNVTPPNLKSVIQSIGLQDASQLLDSGTLQLFQETLKTQTFAFQRILSQVLRRGPYSSDSIEPASAFMLFGQRFVIDSFITGNVVYDKITFNNRLICRLFPSTLDVLFVLGNDYAAPWLVTELDQYCYASNLASLRYLVDSCDSVFWSGSIYTMWLNAIRTLNPFAGRQDLPPFMQTEAWWQQKMNTQLSSWTELRHDNLLYAKQSYTGGGGACFYPDIYVEPFPELYEQIREIADTAHSRFTAIEFSEEYFKTEILDYFAFLGHTMEMLAVIAGKELAGEPRTEEEEVFLHGIYTGQYEGDPPTGCSSGFGFWNRPEPDMDGWYLKLLYGLSYSPFDAIPPFSDYLVADYHTTPTDCWGNPVGWISHAGTGPVDLAIVTVATPANETTAFVGPVMSYYEYRTTNFQRLTDEEWEYTHRLLASRPAWTDSYLADTSGRSKIPEIGSE